jgi:hypothetical protein
MFRASFVGKAQTVSRTTGLSLTLNEQQREQRITGLPVGFAGAPVPYNRLVGRFYDDPICKIEPRGGKHGCSQEQHHGDVDNQ